MVYKIRNRGEYMERPMDPNSQDNPRSGSVSGREEAGSDGSRSG
jgi:hypothetical protein